MDLFLLGLTAALFGLSFLLVIACENLRRPS